MQSKTAIALMAFASLTPVAPAAAVDIYNVDPASVSISGISSGGAMAMQLGVAYSSTFAIGFGVFAGIPYDCARNQSYTLCMYNGSPNITLPVANMKAWSGNQIDPIDNLQDRRTYLQVGSADTTVGVNVMNQVKNQLSGFVNPSDVAYDTTQGASHVFPTDFDSSGNSPCGRSVSPFISNCGFDGAGARLQHLYRSLNPRARGTMTGTIKTFDQTGKFGGEGMGSTGYLYVPQECENGSTVCKLHVALHGCQQSARQIQSSFVQNTGYNKWADTNNIIVLYPQTTVDDTYHFTWNGILPNPNACWDWIGWYSSGADQKSGTQMTAIVNQVKQILGTA